MTVQSIAIPSLTTLGLLLRLLSESLVLQVGFLDQHISITWEGVRNAGSQVPPQNSRNSRGGTQSPVFAGDSAARST